MKSIFLDLTIYNINVNKIIYKFVSELSIDKINHNFNTFYPSIPSIILHVSDSNLRWLSRIAPFSTQYKDKEIDASIIDNINELKAEEKFDIESITKLLETAAQIDTIIEELIGSIDESIFSQSATIKFGKGDITKPLYRLLLQWLNHHTHHRGQISLALEILGVENDYSSILNKI